MTTALINNFALLNRKERHHLLEAVTGGPFVLAPGFRKKLVHALRGRLAQTRLRRLPADIPFIAMDYHLDWVWAALCKTAGDDGIFGAVWVNGKKMITGTQEDIDLLIAFPDSRRRHVTHVIFIEAKGDTAWGNRQFERKIKRLADIVALNKKFKGPRIVPYLVLVSPREPERLNPKSLVPWMKGSGSSIPVAWTRLDRSGPKQTYKIKQGRTDRRHKGFHVWELSGAWWQGD